MNGTFHHVKASTQYKREHKSDYGRERMDILYEDANIVVIHKPSGMLSVPYPGSKARTALDVLEKIMRTKGTYSSAHRPFTVHRLDRDTSGVMMFALTEAVQTKVMDSWHTMVTERLYRAVAENPRNPKKILPVSGLIDLPLAKNSHHLGYVPHDPHDKNKTVEARTYFSVVFRGATHTLFELSLDTGKKNQIRAHLSSQGYPLAGDENYRARTDPFHRLALHARTLAFVHPVTHEPLRFEVPEPEEWLLYVQRGDRHPQTPIWFDREAQRQMRQSYTNSSPVPAPRLSRKQRSKMDFIAQAHALQK